MNMNMNMSMNIHFHIHIHVNVNLDILFRLFLADDEPGMCTHQPVTQPLAAATCSVGHGCAAVRM